MSEPRPGDARNDKGEGEAGAALLRRVAGGDREAFHAFYLRYASRVLAFVRARVWDREMGEELMQDVFVAAWLSAPVYRPELGEPEAWLIGIARHKVIDHWRRLRRIGVAIGLSANVVPATPPVEPDVRLALEQALRRLPADQRSVVDLVYLHGLTFLEAARALGIPLGTVKSRVNAALSAMRAFFTRSAGA